MEPIYPICEEKILPYKGKNVCAVLHDGTYFYGTVNDIRDGQLFLSQGSLGQGKVLAKQKTTKQQASKQRKASVSAFGYPGYGYPGYGSGAGIVLSIALIALLFAGFPFFI